MANVYAIVYLFSVVDKDCLLDPTELVHRFTHDQGTSTKVTDIYLIMASVISRPLIGMKDLPFKVVIM